MKAQLSIVLFLVLFSTCVVAPPSNAQTGEATFEIFSESGRYSLRVPDVWGAATYPENRAHEIRLIGENLVIADTRDHFEEWAFSGHTDGNLLTVRVFPTAAYQGAVSAASPHPDQQIMELHMSVYHEGASTLGTPVYDDSGNWPTLRLNSDTQSIRIIKVDHLIYDISFSGEDTAQLNALADSFTLPEEPVEQFPRNPLVFDSGALSLQTEVGWLIADWGEGNFARPFNSTVAEETTSGIPRYTVISVDNDGELLHQLFSVSAQNKSRSIYPVPTSKSPFTPSMNCLAHPPSAFPMMIIKRYSVKW